MVLLRFFDESDYSLVGRYFHDAVAVGPAVVGVAFAVVGVHTAVVVELADNDVGRPGAADGEFHSC